MTKNERLLTGKRVLIINQHSGNFGDDAAGCALVKMLLDEYNVSKIDIVYNADKPIPYSDSRVHHDFNYSFHQVGYVNLLKYLVLGKFLPFSSFNTNLQSFISTIRNADLILVAPCGANIGIYKDWRFLFRTALIIHEHKTPVFHLNTIGKSGNVFFDFIARKVLHKSAIYVRERKSEEYITSLGLPVRRGPDTAFAVKYIDDAEIRKDTISVIPAELDSWHPFFKKHPANKRILQEIAPCISRFAVERNCNIEILPHLQSKEETQFNIKFKECLIASGMNPEHVKIRTDIDDMYKYDKAIATSSMIIGMRYHAAVLAARNSRPFIALAYENKMAEVCDYTHMLGYYFNLQDACYDIKKLKAQLDDCRSNERYISDSLSHISNDILKPQAHMVLNDML